MNVMGFAAEVHFEVQPQLNVAAAVNATPMHGLVDRAAANARQTFAEAHVQQSVQRHQKLKQFTETTSPSRVNPTVRSVPVELSPRERFAQRPIDLWEQFVQGPSNQLAWTTANLIVADPGRLSPVVLHGPNGCGKSLLAASVAERLRTVKRMRRVVHMSSEQFTNDFMEGLRGGGLPMFRRKYRDVEALILDDIQFFVGKKSTIW